MANTFLRKLSRNIGTSAVQIGSYTVGSATQTTIIGLDLSNTTVNTISVSAYHFDGTNITYLIKNAPIPSGSSLIVVGGDQKVVLQTGDSIYVVSNTATSVDVVMSILEIT